MKHIRIVGLVISLLFLVSGCASLPSDEEQDWVYSSDKVVEVLVQSDGLHLLKNISSSYTDIVFHVEKILPKETDIYVVDVRYTGSYSDKGLLYPFVKKGQKYKIWASYKNKKSGKITESKSVEVIATGGLGEARICGKAESSSYDSKKWDLNLNHLEKTIPFKVTNEKITGNIYAKGTKDPYYFNDFQLSKNIISLKPVMGKIRGKEFSLQLKYSFVYDGITFEQEFVSKEDCVFSDSNTEYIVKNTGLPAVYLNTKSKKPVASREKYEEGTLTIGKQTYDLKVKGRGNSSWGQFPKHSYSLKLNKSSKILGLAKNKSWVLVSNYGDKTLVRNQYCYYLGQEVFNRMMWTPSFKQVDLFINEKYQGTYLLGEKIAVSKERVNIGEGGFIVEMNRREDEYFNFRTTHDVSISLKEPDDADKKTQAKIKKIIQTAEDAMFSKNFKDPQKGYAAYIDVDSFVDWYIINEFAKNVDSAWFSSIYIVYDSKDGKLHLGPLWDYDLGFGNINYNDCDNPEGFYIQTRGVWFAQLFKDPAFRQKVKQRWMEKRSVLEKSIDVQIDKFVSGILESSYYNFETWPIFGEYVWPNADGYEDRLSIQSEITYLKNWCKRRFIWLDDQISKW